MFWKIKSRRKSLKTRLLFWVWLISSFATFTFTSIQLLLDYDREEHLAFEQIDIIERNYIPSINKSLWDYNSNYLNLQLKSAMNLPHVKLARVISDDFTSTDIPAHKRENLKIERIPLIYNDEQIGNLEIGLDIMGIRKNFLVKVFYIFISQALKTLIVCLLLLKIFEKVIMRHIDRMVKFLKDFDVDNDEKLNFMRPQHINDELSTLENSINGLKRDLYITSQNLKELNLDLENKVIERTKLLDDEKARSMQSAKLASLGEMAGGIAHEINNPLAIISTTMQFLKRSIERKRLTDEIMMDSIETVEATVRRTSKIITGLRTVSRSSDVFKKEYVIMRDIFDDVLGLCSAKFRNHGVHLDIDLTSHEYGRTILCDRVQLSQVLVNLLGNAFDAVLSNENKWVKIEFKEEGNFDLILITDSGYGISDEIIEKIFNPFFTSKEIGKGTGLGLSISKSIMEKHGGAIDVDKTVANTCFKLALPKQLVAIPS